MGLAVVRSIDAPRRLRTAAEIEDFEQELVDQYALASAGAGVTDRHVAKERYVLFGFIRFLGRPVWTCKPGDADRYLVHLRKERSLAPATVTEKAWIIAQFFDFLTARYQGDIHALTGHVLVQPIDEFNRPPKPYAVNVRVPPSDDEVETLFTGWREALPHARKYLPAARGYLAASLWRRVGLRITETAMLDIRDWRPDLGELGKLHVRFGKGSHGRGPKSRMVPGINAIGELLQWWLVDVRHQYGDDWADPYAPLLPSERRLLELGHVLGRLAIGLRELAHPALDVGLVVPDEGGHPSHRPIRGRQRDHRRPGGQGVEVAEEIRRVPAERLYELRVELDPRLAAQLVERGLVRDRGPVRAHAVERAVRGPRATRRRGGGGAERAPLRQRRAVEGRE